MSASSVCTWYGELHIQVAKLYGGDCIKIRELNSSTDCTLCGRAQSQGRSYLRQQDE